MTVLIVLVASLLIYRSIAPPGTWASRGSAPGTQRDFTASAHFTRMREDLVRMMPPAIPWPRALVYFTGFCEIAGVPGLMIPLTRRAAGTARVVFFIAVFPANLRAAQSGIGLRGKPATPLWLRAPMQLLFIVLAWWVSR